MNSGNDSNDTTSFSFSPRENRAAEIKWREWSDDIFKVAEEEGKPLLLSISAVWCHWCHVMDETSYSDEDAIAAINENYIPVRVDSDRRPDINTRYNQGGWPTLAFLTSDGEIIAGMTYVPPDQLNRLLSDVSDLYTNSMESIKATVAHIRERRMAEPEPQKADVDRSIIDYVIRVAEEAFDAENGGFGTQPKFPYSNVLSVMLLQLTKDDPGQAGEILRTTLEAMATKGMYDPVEGGFYRYATGADWTAPHYEKMLEDNAQLLKVFTDAYNMSSEESYGKVAYGVMDFMKRVLRDRETGTFGGSQDADEEYYKLDGPGRKEVESPAVDNTVYSGWNSLAASALLRAFQVFSDKDAREMAIKALSYIRKNLWDDEAGLAHYYDGTAQLRGMLIDNARYIHACIDAYESGAGDDWLTSATMAAKWLLDNLEDETDNAFFDCLDAPGQEGYPAERTKPPVDNSVAAGALIRLAQNTGQTRFEDAARSTLVYFGGSFQEFGLFAADYAIAVLNLLEPPVRVTISGPVADDRTVALIMAAHRALVPFRSIEVLDPELHAEELEAVGYGYEGTPLAYICVGASCQPPLDNPAELPMLLENSWSAASANWSGPAGA
jgi:hypothetical protein